MAGKKVPKVYWDTSVWIAHLCTETGWPELERKAVAEVFEKMRRGEAVIVSSVLVLLETVNKCEKRLGVSAQIEALRHHPSLELGDMSIKVAQLARNQMASGLRYGDAIHAATAAWSECDQLWTFDGDFKGEIVEGSKWCVPTRPSMVAFAAIKSLVPKPYTPGQTTLDPLQDSLELDDPWLDDDETDDAV